MIPSFMTIWAYMKFTIYEISVPVRDINICPIHVVTFTLIPNLATYSKENFSFVQPPMFQSS